MPSTSTTSSLPPAKPYWLTRQWLYQLPAASTPLQPVEPGNDYAADKSGRPLTADDRHPQPADSTVDPRVRELLARMQVNLPRQLRYRQAECAIRPKIASLLELMCSAQGEPVPLVKVCRHLWGTSSAPSYSTFHMTVSKANTALSAVDCPLRLRSRLNQLLLVEQFPR